VSDITTLQNGATNIPSIVSWQPNNLWTCIVATNLHCEFWWAFSDSSPWISLRQQHIKMVACKWRNVKMSADLSHHKNSSFSTREQVSLFSLLVMSADRPWCQRNDDYGEKVTTEQSVYKNVANLYVHHSNTWDSMGANGCTGAKSFHDIITTHSSK